jgi:hypothetical protein
VQAETNAIRVALSEQLRSRVKHHINHPDAFFAQRLRRIKEKLPPLVHPLFFLLEFFFRFLCLLFIYGEIAVFIPVLLTERIYRLAAWTVHLVRGTQLRVKPMELPVAKLHPPPGAHLRNFSEFFFSPRVFQKILEPTLRDLFDEYCAALEAGRVRKARWVQLRGYLSFWAAVFTQLSLSLVKRAFDLWKASR